jgi:hypothetical protein
MQREYVCEQIGSIKENGGFSRATEAFDQTAVRGFPSAVRDGGGIAIVSLFTRRLTKLPMGIPPW